LAELKPMYRGRAYSKKTFLAQPLNETATTIYVIDSSVLPPAPNMATIGDERTAETIRYGLIIGNELRNVTRAAEEESVAQAWQPDTPIANYITAKLLNNMADNIDTINEEITEEIGLKNHIIDPMPHRFVANNINYQYGFSVDNTGGLILKYEVV